MKRNVGRSGCYTPYFMVQMGCESDIIRASNRVFYNKRKGKNMAAVTSFGLGKTMEKKQLFVGWN